MNVVSVVLLPARAAVATAETVIAVGVLASNSGPLRRPGGYAERLTAVLDEDGPIERVFDAIDDAARRPQWSKDVTRAELLGPGDDHGLAKLLDAPLLVRS